MSIESLQRIVTLCAEWGLTFAQVVRVLETQTDGRSEEEQYRRMRELWAFMREASRNYEPQLRSASGLSGGDGEIFRVYAQQETSLCGTFVSSVITEALQMAESNACMKRIVAAPTAGSCGVLPAVLLPLYNAGSAAEPDIVEALFVAAGIGLVIAHRASISGAEGGCQAEIGSASAMAAGSLVFLKNGTPEQCASAAGFALQNLLGLVCDPVGGLVEVPCIKRNVIGAVNALAAADMALSGIVPVIPPDEVIDAMRSVGTLMDPSLRETGRGGLAATPAARQQMNIKPVRKLQFPNRPL